MTSVSSPKTRISVPLPLNITRRSENSSLYVGDLEGYVNEAQFYDLFVGMLK
ncbi:polyadenylate-binding protein, partial [Trifolium medium]|nr:polyadenylate-binding protein [Trifolium medium]